MTDRTMSPIRGGARTRNDLFGRTALKFAFTSSEGGRTISVTTSRTRTPAQPLLRGLLVTALASAALTACGGGEPAAEDQPADVSSSPTASSSTPTATPTPTPTVRPLSRFEDEPTVKV